LSFSMTDIIVLWGNDDRHDENGPAVEKHKRPALAPHPAYPRKPPTASTRGQANFGRESSLGDTMTGSMQSADHLLANPATAPVGQRSRHRTWPAVALIALLAASGGGMWAVRQPT